MVTILKKGVDQKAINNKYVGTFLCPNCTAIFELRQSDLGLLDGQFVYAQPEYKTYTARGKCPSCNKQVDNYLDVSHLYERKRLEL